MRGLAGVGSLVSALLLAAKTRGLGKPLEDQPVPQARLSAAQSQHLRAARTFVAVGRSGVQNARIAVIRGNCRQSHTLLQAAEAALENLEVHISLLPRQSADLRPLLSACMSLKKEFAAVSERHDATCSQRAA